MEYVHGVDGHSMRFAEQLRRGGSWNRNGVGDMKRTADIVDNDARLDGHCWRSVHGERQRILELRV